MTTLRNDKTGELLNSPYTNEEAIDLFKRHFAGSDNWLHFWIHKALSRLPKPGEVGLGGACQFIADTFLYAIGHGLKRPMIRLKYKDQRFKLYLSRKGTICLEAGLLHPGTNDPVGDAYYVGCLLRGEFMVASQGYGRGGPERVLTQTEREFVDALKGDPVAFMANCSKDMGSCCYCNQPLEDPRSKLAGYGHTCSKRWGLPWGKTPAEMDKAPSFAKAYKGNAGRELAMLCQAVRRGPDVIKNAKTDAERAKARADHEAHWKMLGDRLQECGLPAIEVPGEDVTLPRADSDGGAPVAAAVKAPAPLPAAPAPAAVDHTLLTWDAAARAFSGEASDLGLGAGCFPPSITVKGKASNKVFRIDGPELDGGGELAAMRYKCDDMVLRLFNN